MDGFGFWSVAPPLTAIVLAFATRQVLTSLFCAVWIGAMIVEGGNPFAGFSRLVVEYIAGSVARPWNASVILYCLTLGGMVGIVTRTGGIGAVADALAARARTARSGRVAVWLMGLMIFFDDYANTMIVGASMRPITDRLRISREKLAYLCDSTAAPVASMALIATWTANELGLIRSAFETAGIDAGIYAAFLRSIPYRFYSILAIVFAGAVAWTGRDFGPMRTAEQRARQTGQVLAEGASPLTTVELDGLGTLDRGAGRWYTAVLPIAVVVLAMGAGLVLSGRTVVLAGSDAVSAAVLRDHPWSFAAVRIAVGEANAATAMLRAVFAGTVVAGLLAIGTRTLSLTETVQAWVAGAKAFLIAVMILVLAWGLGAACRDLGTAGYVVRALDGVLPAGLLPAAVFLTGCLIAFATGTAYGTAAILMPLAVPLALGIGSDRPDGFLYAVIGAVFTGAVFGDHCSPISDTTIMSSMACGSDHIDHVRTQMPYALTAAAIALAAGFIPAGFGLHPLVSLGAGIAAVVLTVRFIGAPQER